MKTTIKFHSIIPMLLMLLLAAASFSSCSKDDEPKLPEEEDFDGNEFHTVLPADLVGEWTLTSIKDITTGEVAEFDITFTILPFTMDGGEENSTASIPGLSYIHKMYHNTAFYNSILGSQPADFMVQYMYLAEKAHLGYRVSTIGLIASDSSSRDLIIELSNMQIKENIMTCVIAMAETDYDSNSHQSTYTGYSGIGTLKRK